MKTIKNLCLMASLLMVVTFSACKKGGEAAPDDEEEFTNLAQLFFNNNSSLQLEGDDINATYTDGKLSISFKKDDNEVVVQIPNYNLEAQQAEYNNGNAIVIVKKGGAAYHSSFITVPVFVGNPPFPVFVQGKIITLTTSNLRVNENTTDISIGITAGSELITVPVSNGQSPVYQTLGFEQGDGGRPNMINVRIKN